MENRVNLSMESRIHGDVYVRFGGRPGETYRSNAVRRSMPSLRDGKIFGLICDDHFYLKPTDAVREMLRTIDMRPPYPGAKPYFYIADVDDHGYLSALVKETCKHLPEPKPKKKK